MLRYRYLDPSHASVTRRSSAKVICESAPDVRCTLLHIVIIWHHMSVLRLTGIGTCSPMMFLRSHARDSVPSVFSKPIVRQSRGIVLGPRAGALGARAIESSGTHPYTPTPVFVSVSQPEKRHHSSLSQHDVERLQFTDGFRRSVIRSKSGIQRRYKSKHVESSSNPLSGLWKPTHLQRLHYGPESVKKHLLECLPNEKSKAFVLTGSSLANKTSLVKQVEQQLGSKHAQTFSKIGQHAPVKELDEATGMQDRAL